MNDEELRQRMECCRPGTPGQVDAEWLALQESADLNPDVRRQLDSIQRWDAAIARAMHDVPVPEGMASRLTQLLEANDDTSREAAPPVIGPVRPRWWSAPATRWSAVAASLAALLAVMIYVSGWRDNLTASQVAESARAWTAELDPEGWLRETPPTADYPVHSALRFAMVGWQRFPALGDQQAVAYEATVPPDRSRAYLFVVRTRAGRLLPDRPPLNPDATTGNLCISSWKSDAFLYVLVVPGSRQNYSRLIRTRAIAALSEQWQVASAEW